MSWLDKIPPSHSSFCLTIPCTFLSQQACFTSFNGFLCAIFCTNNYGVDRIVNCIFYWANQVGWLHLISLISKVSQIWFHIVFRKKWSQLWHPLHLLPPPSIYKHMLLAFFFPVIPSNFNYTTLGVLAANGSSVTGRCSTVVPQLNSKSTCSAPTSSVLFDGIIPTLTALDGNTWASQLMILQQPIAGPQNFGRYSMEFRFASNPMVSRVEVTVFNCPEWGMGISYIEIIVLRPTDSNVALSREQAYTTESSCNSLITVCIPTDTSSSLMRLEFQPLNDDHIHIAEVAFYESSSPCSPFTIIPGNWTPPSMHAASVCNVITCSYQDCI